MKRLPLRISPWPCCARCPGVTSKRLADSLHWSVQQRVAAAGAREAAGAEAVVASYVVAQEAFERADGKRILNYPIAHHRYIQKFVAEEAAREPEFASTLPDWSKVPHWVEPRLDRECDLADFILVGSTFARDSFVAEGIPPEKLVVIPYGADVSRFAPAADRYAGHNIAGHCARAACPVCRPARPAQGPQSICCVPMRLFAARTRS